MFPFITILSDLIGNIEKLNLCSVLQPDHFLQINQID